MHFRTGALSLLVLAIGVAAGCGSSPPRDQLLANLTAAMGREIGDPEQSAEASRTVEEALESDVLTGMTRQEVQEAIGRGSPCSQHPRCAENEFDSDDWYYQVGQPAEGYPNRVPALIVGFDREGKVTRTWNLRTHE